MATTSKFHKLLATTGGGTINGSSTPLIVTNYGVRQTTQRLEDEGARGTRSRNASRIVEGLKPLAGPINAEPSPTELDFWLPFITGGTKSSNNHPLAETLLAKKFGTYLGSTVDRWYEHDACVCQSAQMESATGQKVRWTFNVVGKTETAIDPGSAAFPTVSYDTEPVYTHHNLVATLGGSVSSGSHSGGTAYNLERFTMGWDNGVDPLYRNSQTATDLTARDRIITVGLVLPFTSTERALFTSSAFAAKFVWTIGGRSLTLVFPALIAEPITPTVPGGTGEVLLELNCRAYITGSETQEIFIANDITA